MRIFLFCTKIGLKMSGHFSFQNKVNSVQEACAKCFVVHIFANHLKKMKQRTSDPQFLFLTNRFVFSLGWQDFKF